MSSDGYYSNRQVDRKIKCRAYVGIGVYVIALENASPSNVLVSMTPPGGRIKLVMLHIMMTDAVY